MMRGTRRRRCCSARVCIPNFKLVSEMLGHATVAITLDLYSHATPAMHREAARVLDALLRAQ
jgi:integrase